MPGGLQRSPAGIREPAAARSVEADHLSHAASVGRAPVRVKSRPAGADATHSGITTAERRPTSVWRAFCGQIATQRGQTTGERPYRALIAAGGGQNATQGGTWPSRAGDGANGPLTCASDARYAAVDRADFSYAHGGRVRGSRQHSRYGIEHGIAAVRRRTPLRIPLTLLWCAPDKSRRPERLRRRLSPRCASPEARGRAPRGPAPGCLPRRSVAAAAGRRPRRGARTPRPARS